MGNTAADGSGTNCTSSLATTTEDALDEQAIIVTNNHATDTIYITTMRARGSPVSEGDTQMVEARDQNSIDAYGLREYPHPSTYYPNFDDGIDLADYVLSLASEPAPRQVIVFDAHRSNAKLSEALTRELSVKITVRAVRSTGLVIQGTFFEEEIARSGGVENQVSLTLSSGEAIGTNIVLDLGPGLGVGT